MEILNIFWNKKPLTITAYCIHLLLGPTTRMCKLKVQYNMSGLPDKIFDILIFMDRFLFVFCLFQLSVGRRHHDEHVLERCEYFQHYSSNFPYERSKHNIWDVIFSNRKWEEFLFFDLKRRATFNTIWPHVRFLMIVFLSVRRAA